MSKTILAMAVLAVAALPVVAAPSTAPTRGDTSPQCDRACLYHALASYLSALLVHDPGKALFAPDTHFTENNVALQLGDGLWGTITARGDYDLRFADPKTGSVGFFGVVEESGMRSPIALRLTLRDGVISEVEQMIARPKDAGVEFTTAAIAQKPVLEDILPATSRRSREDMVALANGYFDTLQQNNGVLHTQFSPDCNRRENGFQTTNNPEASKLKPGYRIMALGCEAQFRLGWFRYDTRLRGRRVLVVDEERGLVLMAAGIDHDGRLANYQLTDGTAMASPVRRPHSYAMMEAFKIRDGQIQQVEAVFTVVPYRMPSPWGKLGFYKE